MLLVIDIGNSNITLAYQSRGMWSDIMRHSTKNEHNEIHAMTVYQNFIARDNVQYTSQTIDTIIISSVVPTLTPIIQEIIHNIFYKNNNAIKIIMVDLTIHSPLTAPIPAELGNDLFANAVASYSKSNLIMNKSVIGTNLTTPTASITVDMGTALSFIAVDGGGTILGVSITTGIETALNALIKNTEIENTRQLPTYDLNIPVRALGKTTQEALNSGIMLGYKHLIKGMVGQIKDEVGTPMKVYATGGLSKMMKSLAHPHDTVFDEINPYHTLNGLSILATYN